MVGIESNNLSYTGIKVSRLAFTISLLIVSENGDLLLFNLRISFLIIQKSRRRECSP